MAGDICDICHQSDPTGMFNALYWGDHGNYLCEWEREDLIPESCISNPPGDPNNNGCPPDKREWRAGGNFCNACVQQDVNGLPVYDDRGAVVGLMEGKFPGQCVFTFSEGYYRTQKNKDFNQGAVAIRFYWQRIAKWTRETPLSNWHITSAFDEIAPGSVAVYHPFGDTFKGNAERRHSFIYAWIYGTNRDFRRGGVYRVGMDLYNEVTGQIYLHKESDTFTIPRNVQEGWDGLQLYDWGVLPDGGWDNPGGGGLPNTTNGDIKPPDTGNAIQDAFRRLFMPSYSTIRKVEMTGMRLLTWGPMMALEDLNEIASIPASPKDPLWVGYPMPYVQDSEVTWHYDDMVNATHKFEVNQHPFDMPPILRQMEGVTVYVSFVFFLFRKLMPKFTV